MAERDEITAAAYDSKPEDKEVADFLCDGIDDHIEIQAAFDLAARTGKPFRPLLGTYNLRESKPMMGVITEPLPTVIP